MVHLDLHQLHKRFGESVAVHDVTLRVERGEFVSFLGPSGCGKTTTLRMVAGFELPSSGAITLADQDLTNTPANRRNIGMVFQSYALFPNMTVAQNIGFGLRLRNQNKAAIERKVSELLTLIGLPDKANAYPTQLSGGQQQRVALARALAIEPQVLLLDEPLSALDARIRVSLREEIRAIQRKLGITTIYVTHDQEEAMALSDRVVVMHQGRVEQIGTPFQIYNHPATGFVAAFIGTLNALPAQVADPAAGIVRVGAQTVRVARSLANRRLNEAVTLALRPEALAPADANVDNALRVTVAEITFLGPVVRVRARLDGAALSYDQFNSPALQLPQPGDTVTLRVPPEAALVLDAV